MKPPPYKAIDEFLYGLLLSYKTDTNIGSISLRFCRYFRNSDWLRLYEAKAVSGTYYDLPREVRHRTTTRLHNMLISRLALMEKLGLIRKVERKRYPRLQSNNRVYRAWIACTPVEIAQNCLANKIRS